MASPLRLGIFGALSEARGKQRARQQEQAALQQAAEDRRLAMEDRTRRQSLEDMLRQRQDEQYQYNVSQRPLEEALRRAQIGATNAQASQRLGTGQPKPRPLPLSAVNDVTQLDDLIAQGSGVAASVKSASANKKNVTGARFVPTWAKDMFGMGNKGDDKTGTEVRAEIGRLFSDLAKQRGGTALSDAEIGLLQKWVPNDDDPEEIVISKATRFVEEMQRIRARKLTGYQEYGGFTIGGGGGNPANDLESGLPNKEY